jgi:hypothetical protein
MSTTPPEIPIPADLLPADGRFCCGPSKVRSEAVAALAAAAPTYLGTSHRQGGVPSSLRDKLKIDHCKLLFVSLVTGETHSFQCRNFAIIFEELLNAQYRHTIYLNVA